MSKDDVKIVTFKKQYLMWSPQTNLQGVKQSRTDLITIKNEKNRVNLNKPIYIGTSILDLSIVLKQDFRYNYIKNKYGD